jgi:two-component system OmpR family sensor kinase
MYSLRRAVSVRYSLTIFGALFVIAIWAYFGTRRVLKESLDANLVASAELEAAVLASRLPIAVQPGPDTWDEFIHSVNRFVVIRSSDGSLVEANTPLATTIPVDRRSLERALQGDTAWVTQEQADGELRSYYAPAPRGSREGHAVVQVTASLHPLREATREVLFLMLGTVFLGAVATAIGAGWLAQTSVAPVQEITEQAQSIQPGAGQRITAHADTEEFTGLVDVLNDAFQRLEQAFVTQRRMIADAGHDLRTPLTAMRGEIEIALRGERRPEEYRRVLHSVLEEVDHLTSISDSLGLLARLEAGALSLERVDRDVCALVERATQKAQARDPERRFTYACATPEAAASVDSRLLEIVLNQLLDNSIKHTPAGTAVRTAIERDERHVTITVDDDGPGIPSEAIPRLFEPFYRSDAARTRTGAAGLGLTVAAAIIGAHGGVIEAAKSPMGGLRIVLRLPRTA